MLGDWEQRKLKTRDDIREVAYLYREAPDLFQEFRNTLDLDSAYSKALARRYQKQARDQADPTGEVFDALALCSKELRNLPFRMLMDEGIRARLFTELDQLEEAIRVIREGTE